MKGLVLAGGLGTRLWPMTKTVSKQLLPVYNKPMIYYPIATLMQAGINEILIITAPNESQQFLNLLGDGATWGASFSYAIQPKPEGIAQALILGERFLNQDCSALILGDNLFFGEVFSRQTQEFSEGCDGATVFAHAVARPEAYGVIELDKLGSPIGIVEKPKSPKSHLAVTGLYFYDGSASAMARNLKPSPRGELEITDLNNAYLKAGKLSVKILGRGTAWLDTGSPNDLMEASQFVKAIETRQGQMVGCPEEIAYRNGWIDKNQLLRLAEKLLPTEYGKYLQRLSQEPEVGKG